MYRVVRISKGVCADCAELNGEWIDGDGNIVDLPCSCREEEVAEVVGHFGRPVAIAVAKERASWLGHVQILYISYRVEEVDDQDNVISVTWES